MSDTLTLKHTVKDEPSPRSYTLRGGDFAAMKDAVKAAGGVFQSNPVKAWAVNRAILDALKAAGYTVEAWPFLRMMQGIDGTISDQPSRPVTVDVYFEYINTDGRYRAMPGCLRVVVGEITQEAVQAANDEINAGLVTIGLQPSGHLDRFTAVRKISRAAAEAAAADVVAAFDAASGGKRTAEAIKAGFTAVKQMVY